MESVIFENQTDLPIILETWKPISSGLSSTFDTIIESKEIKTIISSTGEWKLHIMFSDKESISKWDLYYKTKNLNSSKYIDPYLGKFRNNPCLMGNYAWLDTNNFEITFDKSQNKVIFNMIS